MKINKIFIIVSLIIFSLNKISATAQAPDYLIIEKDTLKLHCNPLETYFEKNPLPDNTFTTISTGLWRGYIAYFKIKNNKLILIALTCVTLTSCGSWVRIGDLTSISNRNLDDSKTYVLLNREVEETADSDSDALEQAIDNLTKKYEGEFLRNVKVYVKSNGKKVKVVGDVWGTQTTLINVSTEANAKVILNVGDSVVFKRKGKLTDGKIIGVNSNLVIVEYDGDKKVELKYDEVTKTNK